MNQQETDILKKQFSKSMFSKTTPCSWVTGRKRRWFVFEYVSILCGHPGTKVMCFEKETYCCKKHLGLV